MIIQPEEQLRKLSLDQEISHVLKTPNKIKYNTNHYQFQAWEYHQPQHPFSNTQKIKCYTKNQQQNKLKSKSIKFYHNNTPQLSIKHNHLIKQNNHLITQNKQNAINQYKSFNHKIIKLLDEQTLSPNSRKIITPKKHKAYNQYPYTQKLSQRQYQTPKSSHRTKQISLKKLSSTQGINKIYHSQKRYKYFINDETPINDSFNNNDEQNNGYKIPLSAIVYPVLKSNCKKPPRRIQRFHSFIARTVRK